jgi:subtilisin family serine protease
MKVSAHWLAALIIYTTPFAVRSAEPALPLPIAVPGEYLIRRAPGQEASRVLANLRQRLGAEVSLVEDIPEERLLRVRLPSAFDTPAAHARALREQSFALSSIQSVDQLEPVVSYRLTQISDDTRTMVAIADVMKRIGLPPTAPLSPLPSTPPLVIAVIDTGFYLRHEVFKGLMLPGTDVTRNVPAGGPDPAEAQELEDGAIESHGTAMAGLVALMIRGGKVDGAPIANIKILPIRAATSVSGDQRILSSDAIKAFRVAIKQGASVVSASWGDGAESAELMRIVVEADSAKMILVTAAGNGRKASSTDPALGVNIDQPANRVYPASWHLPNMVSVAALDLDDTLARYSNWGPTSVQLAAPGTAIMTPIPGDKQPANATASAYQTSTGTSVATPLVAGMAALYRASHPSATHRGVAAWLSSTAQRDPSLQNKVGSGGKLSGTKLSAAEPSGVSQSQIRIAFDAAPAPVSAAQAALLSKPLLPQVLPSGTLLRGRDSNGEAIRTVNKLEFLVRLKSGQLPADALSGLPFAIGTVNGVRQVDGPLYSVGVDAIADGASAKNALTKLPGVMAVEPATAFRLH